MANTLTKIGTVYVTSAVASVSFTLIPGSYTDLLLDANARTSWASNYWDDMNMTFNGSASGYSGTVFYNNGGSNGGNSSGGSAGWAGWCTNANTGANIFGNNKIYIPNYAGSNYKSWSVDSTIPNNATQPIVGMNSLLWQSTAAITSLTIVSANGSSYLFQPGSKFTLYGI